MKIKRMIMVLAAAGAVLWMTRAGAEGEKRTLTRTEDFVVLAGRELAALAGSEVNELRLYSCLSEKCGPVPMQADKVDELGRYVFPAEKNAERDGSALDGNDEVSFMASDAGDRAPGFRPEGAARGVEIELTDPLDGGRAWVYLFEGPGPGPGSGSGSGPGPAATADYIDYAVEDGNAVLRSPQYELGWGLGMINANYLRLMTPEGKLSEDVLDRQRIGLQARFAGEKNIPLEAPESLVKARDLAVIDGPVRVIIDQDVVLRVADLDIQWGTEYFVKYYRCGQNNSVFFSFPTSLNVLKTITFYWSLDFNDRALGSSYLDANRADPIPVAPGKVSSIPGDAPHFWWGMYGPNGAVLQALDLDDDMLPFFACNGRWIQDPDARDRKGDDPGLLDIGFTCGEKGKMPEKKDYHWFNFILFPKDPSVSGVRQMQALVEHPLTTAVSALAP